MKNTSLLAFTAILTYSINSPANVFSIPSNENILYESNYSLNEYIVHTLDKKCFMHYLSPFVIPDGLTFQITSQTNENSCLDKGFSEIQLLDSQNNIIQTIEGYFLNGFFIGDLPLNSYVIKRSASPNSDQYLYYFIDENKELGISYIGRMISQETDGIYSAFNACPVFEIFLQTQNKDLFKEQSTIQNLFTVVKSYAQTLCPQVKTIVFAATDSPSLSEKGIFFQEYLNKDDFSALWFPDMEKSFNYVINPKIEGEKENIQIEQNQPMQKKSNLYTIHISDKGNAKVFFIDKPYLMKSNRNEVTKNLKTGWYKVEADLSPMSDLEKKKSGISLNEKAAMIEIHSAKQCANETCTSEE